jgi:hypothetical protein
MKFLLAVLGLVLFSSAFAVDPCANNDFYNWALNQAKVNNVTLQAPGWINFNYQGNNMHVPISTSLNWEATFCSWILANTNKNIWTIGFTSSDNIPFTLVIPAFVASNANFTQWTWTAPAWVNVSYGAQSWNVTLNKNFNYTALGESMEKQLFSQSIWQGAMQDTSGSPFTITMPAWIFEQQPLNASGPCANNSFFNFMSNVVTSGNYTINIPPYLEFQWGSNYINVDLATTSSVNWENFACEVITQNTGQSIWKTNVPTADGQGLEIQVPAWVSSNANFTQWNYTAPAWIFIAYDSTAWNVTLPLNYNWAPLQAEWETVVNNPYWQIDFPTTNPKVNFTISTPAISVKNTPQAPLNTLYLSWINNFTNFLNSANVTLTSPSYVVLQYQGQTISVLMPPEIFVNWNQVVYNWIATNTNKMIWSITLPTMNCDGLTFTMPEFISLPANGDWAKANITQPAWVDISACGINWNITLPPSSFNWTSTVNSWEVKNTNKQVWQVAIPTSQANSFLTVTLPAYFSIDNYVYPDLTSTYEDPAAMCGPTVMNCQAQTTFQKLFCPTTCQCPGLKCPSGSYRNYNFTVLKNAVPLTVPPLVSAQSPQCYCISLV